MESFTGADLHKRVAHQQRRIELFSPTIQSLRILLLSAFCSRTAVIVVAQKTLNEVACFCEAVCLITFLRCPQMPAGCDIKSGDERRIGGLKRNGLTGMASPI